MIIPSQIKQQTDDTLADTLDNVLEKVLAEIPLRVIPEEGCTLLRLFPIAATGV